MTKGQFGLLAAALGLATMAGTGYIGYAHAASAGSPGTGASGTALGGGGAGQGPATGSAGSAADGPTGAAGPTAAAGSASASPAAGGGPTTPGGQSTGSAPECGSTDVQVSETDGEGAAGHLSVLIDFTDVSGHACYLRGYPGASVFGPGGTVLANAVRKMVGPAGGAIGLGAPPLVVLQPAGTASAIVEWSDVPTGSGGCLNPVSLGVTPPDSKQTTTFEMTGQAEVCSGFEVHPVPAADASTG